ncbi:hypothetical protein RHMOL_Rhmol02G0025800 [Rhododendron molle]|uniref:Uncharacterized protein n=1 Tax=Rhododendron molle TaxID=49168 RepID=A0ACC0PKL4_RHOML|nr:hypothetical protein RHMOL_Rhmol02G0025800 [Rhododendron molle]
MATAREAQAVKSLNKTPRRRRFAFKTLSQRLEEIDVDVFRSLDPLKSLLSEGSSFFRDCLVEWRVIIRQTVLESESKIKVLDAVSPLLISGNSDVRMSVCDLLDALAGTESSLIAVAKLVRELNSTSVMEMGGLDYDSIINAYEKINKDFFYTVREKHALIILSHAVHDMSSEEMILRQSGFGLLLSFVEFSAEILDRDMRSDDQSWPESSIARIINKFIFKHMGDAMNKEAPIQKVWIDLLREMVLKLPMVPSLKSFQKHRRSRALSRFRNFVSSGNLSEVITTKVFVSLFFNMLFELQNGKAENVRSACLEALASISGNMEWESYYAFLMRCFREMTRKSVMQKVLLRLICFVLDHFHFMDNAKDSVEGSKAGTTGMTSKIVLRRCYSSAEVTEIQACLQKTVLQKIQKLLTSDSDNVNVRISVVALKLLKLLPGDVMEFQLPSIVHRISNFLKHRLESICDEARVALAACLKELGLEYLHFIVKVLRSDLKRGYELHVLGYTLNFILSKFLVNPISGKLDYCLEELLSVMEHDILGDVSEEKEVEQISSKMKETREFKSFETLQLIAQNITFKTQAVKLLEPVTSRLQKHLTPKVKSKLECMLTNIAAGIECNPSINQADLFILLYGHIKDGITYETHTNKRSSVANTNKQPGDKAMCKIIVSAKLIDSCSQSSHLITVFALGLLHNCLKSRKCHKKDEELLSKLDPFVRLLTEYLTSKYEDIIAAALSYEHSSGRETVLEMLHVIVIKFPKAVNEHSLVIFVLLVFCLANDNDNKVRSMTGAAIKLLIGHVRQDSLDSILEFSFSWYMEQDLRSAAAAQVLGLLVEVMKEGFKEHINGVLPVMRSIFRSAVDVLKIGPLDLSVETTWKGAYYSLIMLEKILHQFRDRCLAIDLEDIWDTICELLLHPHMWLRDVLNRLVALYFASVKNHDKSLETFFLMRPSRLFLIAVSLCCQLNGPLVDNASSTYITQNFSFALCAVHSLLGPDKLVGACSIWSTLEHHEQGQFFEVFELLDSGKGGSMFVSLTSGDNKQNAEENSDRQQSLLVTLLLKRMGKIALQMDAVQMKIVFNVFKSISPKILDPEKFSSKIGDFQGYEYQLLLPSCKVCEGCAGKVVPDDVKQLAQEALETIRDTLGMNKFALVYCLIRKNLKTKRNKRKQGEKLMAVVNPMQNAKRKLRISEKNRANKKRKVMSMRMTKWMR